MKGVKEDFHDKYIPEPMSGCFLWEGLCNPCTPNYMQAIFRKQPAARVAWTLHCGPIAPGLCVLHRCDNSMCVNPEHLFLGSRSDNTQDMMRKGRHRYIAPRPYKTKLTPEIVRKIRQSTASNVELGRLYDIDRTAIWLVRAGKTWRNVS